MCRAWEPEGLLLTSRFSVHPRIYLSPHGLVLRQDPLIQSGTNKLKLELDTEDSSHDQGGLSELLPRLAAVYCARAGNLTGQLSPSHLARLLNGVARINFPSRSVRELFLRAGRELGERSRRRVSAFGSKDCALLVHAFARAGVRDLNVFGESGFLRRWVCGDAITPNSLKAPEGNPLVGVIGETLSRDSLVEAEGLTRSRNARRKRLREVWKSSSENSLKQPFGRMAAGKGRASLLDARDIAQIAHALATLSVSDYSVLGALADRLLGRDELSPRYSPTGDVLVFNPNKRKPDKLDFWHGPVTIGVERAGTRGQEVRALTAQGVSVVLNAFRKLGVEDAELMEAFRIRASDRKVLANFTLQQATLVLLSQQSSNSSFGGSDLDCESIREEKISFLNFLRLYRRRAWPSKTRERRVPEASERACREKILETVLDRKLLSNMESDVDVRALHTLLSVFESMAEEEGGVYAIEESGGRVLDQVLQRVLHAKFCLSETISLFQRASFVWLRAWQSEVRDKHPKSSKKETLSQSELLFSSVFWRQFCDDKLLKALHFEMEKILADAEFSSLKPEGLAKQFHIFFSLSTQLFLTVCKVQASYEVLLDEARLAEVKDVPTCPISFSTLLVELERILCRNLRKMKECGWGKGDFFSGSARVERGIWLLDLAENPKSNCPMQDRLRRLLRLKIISTDLNSKFEDLIPSDADQMSLQSEFGLSKETLKKSIDDGREVFERAPHILQASSSRELLTLLRPDL